jgi:hypothetical protein
MCVCTYVRMYVCNMCVCMYVCMYVLLKYARSPFGLFSDGVSAAEVVGFEFCRCEFAENGGTVRTVSSTAALSPVVYRKFYGLPKVLTSAGMVTSFRRSQFVL